VAYPQFLIIGAQKCGTTWLHRQLREHAQIHMPADKDTPIFSYGRRPSQEQLRAWRARLQPPDNGLCVGDASAAWLWTETGLEHDRKPDGYNTDVVGTITRFLPDSVQLIAILRDPIERAISAYFHHLTMGSLGAEEHILAANDQRGLVGIGFYAAHLRNWLKRYPLDRLLMLTEPLPRFGNSIRDRVAGFLGIAYDGWRTQASDVVFGGVQRQVREDGIWLTLRSPYLDARPPEGKPVESIGGDTCVRLVDRDELEALVEIYRDDLHDLADLVGEEALQHWPTWQRVRGRRGRGGACE